jgi:hypothetical protein
VRKPFIFSEVITINMKQALITIHADDDVIEAQGRLISADEYAQMLSEGEIDGTEELTHPKNSGLIKFRAASQHGDKIVDAHFVYAPRHSPTYGFSSPQNYKTIAEALKDGAKILIDLDKIDLSYRPLDFAQASDPNMQSLEGWKSKQPKYLKLAVKSADEVITLIKKIAELKASPKEVVSVLYRGGVLPYQDFYIGGNEAKISALYQGLKTGALGQDWPKNRVGFPRMMHFKITKTTAKERGKRGIKGNFIRTDENGLFSTAVVNTKNQKAGLHDSWETVREGKGEFYLIACPSVAVSKDPLKNLSNMRWLINHPKKQMSAITNNPRPIFSAADFR